MYQRGSRLRPPAMFWVSFSDGSCRAAFTRSWISWIRSTGSARPTGSGIRIRVIRLPPSASPGTRMLIGIVTISSSTSGAVLLVVAPQPGGDGGQEGVVEAAAGAVAGLLERR